MERTQLEQLSIQAKALKFALQFGNETMLSQATLAVTQQTEYCMLRIAEGKYEWFGPWMIAESVRIEGLRMLAKNESKPSRRV